MTVTKTKREQRPHAISPAGPANVYDALDKLVGMADLLGVNLVRVDAQLHPEKLQRSNEDLQLIVAPAEFRAGFDPKNAILQCGVKLRLQVATDGADQSSSVLEVTAEYINNYGVPKDAPVSDAVMRLFASRTAVFNAWPFFRELAHSLVARMNLPPLVLPLFRLPAHPRPIVPLPKAKDARALPRPKQK
jgi:hypothetical protein